MGGIWFACPVLTDSLVVPSQGFVRENPTAPIQLRHRPAPRCLNEFCRLGCICSSLSYCSRISHCGRPACMLGCSCLKQKVVLLKNLDGSDTSPSRHGNNRKRRKRRMKMAYSKCTMQTSCWPAESRSEQQVALCCSIAWFHVSMMHALLPVICSSEGGRQRFPACRAGADPVEEGRC